MFGARANTRCENAGLCFGPGILLDESRSAAYKQVLGEDMAHRLSFGKHVTKAWPPTVQFYGTADRLLPGALRQ